LEFTFVDKLISGKAQTLGIHTY